MTKEVSNWGRWGPDDPLGMLNILNAQSVLSAVRLVKKGVVYNLAVPLEKDGPQLQMAQGRQQDLGPMKSPVSMRRHKRLS